MWRISSIAKMTAISAIASLEFFGFAPVVLADVPSVADQGSSQNNPQLNKLLADAAQALNKGDLPLATIELKNALRLDPNNGTGHALLGTTLLQSNQPVPAEHELRLARADGAKDQDVVPSLLRSMLINKEWKDLLAQFANPDPSDRSSLAASILSARALADQYTGNNADANLSIDRSLAIRRDVTGLLTRAEIAMLQANPSDALTYVNIAVSLFPNDPNALIMKAELISPTDKNAALAITNGILKDHPNALNATMAKIELLLQLGRNDEAQKTVDAVLSRDPNMAFAVFYKALLLGIHNKPLDGWRIAQSLPPEFIQSEARFAMGAAQLAAASGNLESANSILGTYVAQHPTVSEPRLQLAALHIKMKNPGGALDDLGPLMDSKDPRVLEYIAATYATLQRPNDAVTYLRKADAAGSKSARLKFQLAMVDLRQGATSQGTQEMADGLTLEPGNLNAPEAGIDLLVRQSKFTEAQALADQSEKTNPKSPAPPFFKGEILLAQGKKDESLAAFNQSLKRDPHYLPALYATTQVFVAENKIDAATNIWKQLEAQQPNNPLPYVKLAEIAARQKQSPQSIALLKQAIAKDPKLIATRLTLAKYQVSLKQYADAEETLKTALGVDPKNAQTLALYGEVQQQLGQTAAAIGTNKTLVEENQKSGAAQALLANSLLSSGDKKGAIAAIKRATELSPDALPYRVSLINLQIQTGDNDGALATARSWGSTHSGPDGAILLAETLVRLKRFPEAASVVAASQKSQPDLRLTILDSQIAMARGDRPHAISILKNWLADHATDIPVRATYASILMTMNDNAGALAQYEIIMKARTDIPDVLNNMAWLIKDTDPNRALNLASKALQLQPNSPQIGDTLGSILLKKGDTKSALPVLQQAHATAPANGEISYHLAQVLNALGRKAEAKQLIQAALAQGDTFDGAADAKKLLQKL